VKVGSLSAVARVPCDPAQPLWLKAACAHFHAEPALTRLVGGMDPDHAPRVVAVDDDRAWMLIEDLAGADEDREDELPDGFGVTAARATARAPAFLDHLPAIEAAGVPVRGLSETLRSFDQILVVGVELEQLSAGELAAVRGLRDQVAGLFDELAAYGVPETLVHGDLHTGNIAHADEALVLYDWSDAAVSHPFLDLVRLTERLPEAQQAETGEAYVDAWRAAYPGLDTERVLTLAGHVNEVFQAVTFEQIQRAAEDASRWEMGGVVARILRRLPDRLASTR
jgi:aminoglycoside phosphotransferase (APT) family kinase protein